MSKYRECPHCPAIWDFNEIEDQQCGACGWPDVDEETDGDEDFDRSFESACDKCGLTMDHSIDCPNN